MMLLAFICTGITGTLVGIIAGWVLGYRHGYNHAVYLLSPSQNPFAAYTPEQAAGQMTPTSRPDHGKVD